MSLSHWIIIDETPLENYPLKLHFSVIKPEAHGLYNSYITIITSDETLKLHWVKDLYVALEEVLYKLKEVEKVPSGTIIYTIYDMQKGIRFVPDIKMLSMGLDYVTKIEQDTDLKLNGAVAIVGDQRKSYKRLLDAANFFAKNLHIRIAKDYNAAYEIIKSYGRTNEIRRP